MTALAHPLVLWVAVLVCLAVALRRRTGPAESAPGDALPGALRLLIRAPAPAALRRLVRRPGSDERIARAGLDRHLSVGGLERARAGGALAGAALALPVVLAAPAAAVLLAPAALLGGMAPDRWLLRRAAGRRRAVVRELPDLIDVLELSVESGMALDPALEMAGDRLGGVLGAEVRALLRDLAFGTPRRAAYQALVARTASPELAQAVGAVLQADELGAPLSAALAGQGEALRVRRRQAARDRAARAAPKIQLVVALVMVPAVLLLVLGVLVIELTRQVGVVVGG